MSAITNTTTNIHHSSTSVASSSYTPQSDPSTSALFDRLAKFIREVPDEEVRLTKEEQKIAQQLREELHKLFTDAKLFQLSEITRTTFDMVLETSVFLNNPLLNLTDQSLRLLELWKSGDTIGNLEFLKTILKGVGMLEEAAPSLPTKEPSKTLSLLSLHFIKHEYTEEEILQEAAKEAKIEKCKKVIKVYENQITELQNNVDACSNYQFTSDKIFIQRKKIEEKTQSLSELNSFLEYLEMNTTSNLTQALVGAKLYFGYLHDHAKTKHKCCIQ